MPVCDGAFFTAAQNQQQINNSDHGPVFKDLLFSILPSLPKALVGKRSYPLVTTMFLQAGYRRIVSLKRDGLGDRLGNTSS